MMARNVISKEYEKININLDNCQKFDIFHFSKSFTSNLKLSVQILYLSSQTFQSWHSSKSVLVSWQPLCFLLTYFPLEINKVSNLFRVWYPSFNLPLIVWYFLYFGTNSFNYIPEHLRNFYFVIKYQNLIHFS